MTPHIWGHTHTYIWQPATAYIRMALAQTCALLHRLPPAHLGQVSRVRRDLVRDDARLDVVAVGQAQVLLGRDVAQQRRACRPAAPPSAALARHRAAQH